MIASMLEDEAIHRDLHTLLPMRSCRARHSPDLDAVRQVKIPPSPAKRMAALLEQSQRAKGPSSTKSAALH